MKIIKILLSSIFTFCLLINVSSSIAEKIVYIDMDKIMQISKAGKEAISKINDQKKKDERKFQKIKKNIKSKKEE